MRDLMEIQPAHVTMAQLEYHWRPLERFPSGSLVPVVIWERPPEGPVGEMTFLAVDTDEMADGYLRQRALVSIVSLMTGVCWCCSARTADGVRWRHEPECPMREAVLGEMSPN